MHKTALVLFSGDTVGQLLDSSVQRLRREHEAAGK